LEVKLNVAGFATLAIDLRGHGESTDKNGEKLNFKKFGDFEHQQSRLDVDAAINFLKGKGFNEDSIGVVGASIGSNLSLDAMYRYSGILRGVILSPGLNYRGVLTKPAITGLSPNQKAWLIAANEDEFSAESCKVLHDLRKDSSALTIFDGIEHGTDLFASEPKLVSDIVKFLSQ
jgi:alpha-beta hydrolase superfamily lysophospholipase